MHELTLDIANIKIKLTSEVSGLIERFREMYLHYIANEEQDPYATLDIQCTDMMQFINREAMPFEQDKEIIHTDYIYSSAYNPVSKKAKLLTNLKNLYPFSEEYLLNLFTHVCLEQNKLLFHCAFLYDDHRNAYVLFGPSGIGKSTIVKNSKKFKTVSDDLVIIESLGNDLFKSFKTPFERNKNNLQKENEFKIKGFFRLNQSRELQIEKLSHAQKATSLLGNIWNSDFSPSSHEKYFQLITTAFKNIPGYNLYLKKDNTFDDVIKLGGLN